jgi:hypothetical protein
MQRALLVLGVTLPGVAAADPGQLNADSFPVRAAGPLRVEGGLVTGFAPVLSTGLTTGLGAAATYRLGVLRLGGRAAWVSATESSLAWEVTQQDLQARALVGIEHRAGRGAIGVRLGLGGSLIREHRIRAQGGRAGLEGDELEMTALALLPAADLEATIGVQIVGAWSAQLAGGPSLLILDGEARASWVATIGVGWQP